MTFYHYVEEQLQVPYRYHKRFTAPYADLSGAVETKTYGLFVRDVERQVLTDVDRMGEKLWNDGVYVGDRPGVGCGLRSLAASEIYDSVATVIHEGKAMDYLYSIGEIAAPGR
jgi:aminoglycoside 3-N-acetyltransferase